jgi:hypothetical protein
MGKKEFEDFVNKEIQKENKTINWQGKLDRWKSNINDLLGKIENWLKDYTVSGKISIESKEIEIFEEAIGRYFVPSLLINISGNIIHVKPIGTVMIGTIGRVDIIGKSASQKIILVDKNATRPSIQTFINTTEEERNKNEEKIKELANTPVEWEWKFASEPPKIKYSDLNQESFFECLMAVING